VCEAVESALNQTTPFEQILVVDDGSTDGSLQLLERKFGRDSRVQIFCKPNGGQLSSFNFAIPRVTGDVLFFLDADDRFRPSYCEKAFELYARSGADFVIAGLENFGPGIIGTKPAPRERDLGFSVLTTMFAGTWIGAPTSCISMRTALARQILPYPFEAEWRIRADNILVYAASILGARKYQLGGVHVDRRVHGANLYYGRSEDRAAQMRSALSLNRLNTWYTTHAGYGLEDLPRLLPREFRTLERPTLKEYRRYLRLSLTSRQTIVRRAKQFLSLSAHMLVSRFAATKAEQREVVARETLRRAA
jgi:glycosyltransferase involved in cell wall biosynthesis